MKKVTLSVQTVTPPKPIKGFRSIYFKDGAWKDIDDAGSISNLGGSGGATGPTGPTGPSATPSISQDNGNIHIGTTNTQYIGFYGITGAQRSSGALQAVAPAGGTGAVAGAYDSAVNRDALISLVNEMRSVLVNTGLMKGSA